MVATPTQSVTIDRISNAGNAIAQQQHDGKTVHVPAGEVGQTYDVRLVDQGGYFEARLVDKTEETQPRQPRIGPDTSDIGKDLLKSSRDQSHSFEVRPSIIDDSGDTRGQKRRRWLSRRKM
ncbi:hypothetical protein EIK79_17600 [Halocatena pleomorpha]|uniref:TRAM domain-containing protein n=1 Tax=Halocatena pleomorpha TaxID=1785090 RepID=A0A3P3R2M6_9EURY|nr:hypothetical protein EIK79_17600 [Halocatena pleomorpha]